MAVVQFVLVVTQRDLGEQTLKTYNINGWTASKENCV